LIDDHELATVDRRELTAEYEFDRAAGWDDLRVGAHEFGSKVR
jgi:hypothetical protein